MNMKKNLKELIECSSILGLDKKDCQNALEYLEYNEYGLSFDTIITQLFEYDIEISIEFYSLIEKIANLMELPEESYNFMKGLIRQEKKIPDLVTSKIAEILNSLKK